MIKRLKSLSRSLIPAVAALGFLIGTTSASHACACCGTWKVTGVSETDNLNIRSGPGTRYRIVGGIPANSACVIKTGKCYRRWCKISYAQSKGWVHTGYLRWKK
ncbi:MAG: SH3 domain-containing protein [Hyphomicrobiaceae bacterium]